MASLISASAERLAAGPPLDEQFELVLGVEALDLAGRVHLVVPEPVVVAVGVEDHRPLAELLLQAVGVELCLLLAELAETCVVRFASTRPSGLPSSPQRT